MYANQKIVPKVMGLFKKLNVPEMEKIGQGRDAKSKPVLDWKEETDPCKPMVANVTNWEFLIEEFGDDPDAWEGEPVEIYVGDTTFGGKPTKGLRLRMPNEDEDDEEDERKSRKKSKSKKSKPKKSRKRPEPEDEDDEDYEDDDDDLD